MHSPLFFLSFIRFIPQYVSFIFRFLSPLSFHFPSFLGSLHHHYAFLLLFFACWNSLYSAFSVPRLRLPLQSSPALGSLSTTFAPLFPCYRLACCPPLADRAYCIRPLLLLYFCWRKSSISQLQSTIQHGPLSRLMSLVFSLRIPSPSSPSCFLAHLPLYLFFRLVPLNSLVSACVETYRPTPPMLCLSVHYSSAWRLFVAFVFVPFFPSGRLFSSASFNLLVCF